MLFLTLLNISVFSNDGYRALSSSRLMPCGLCCLLDGIVPISFSCTEKSTCIEWQSRAQSRRLYNFKIWSCVCNCMLACTNQCKQWREAAVAGRQPDVRTYPGLDDQPVCLNQRADVDGAGVGGGGRHVLQSDRQQQQGCGVKHTGQQPLGLKGEKGEGQ